jgi:hypothetical protein
VGKVKASNERLATGKPMTIGTMRLGEQRCSRETSAVVIRRHDVVGIHHR